MKSTLFHPTFPRAAVGVLLAAAVLAGAASVLAEPPSVDPPTAAEHDAAVAWCRIRTLRQETGLTDDGLARMACTQGQAEAALSSLVSWYDTNREALATRRAGLARARRELGDALQTIHIGPRDEALIARVPSLKSAVASARTSLNTLLDAAAAAACSGLSSGQRAIRAALVADSDTLSPSQRALLDTAAANIRTHMEGVLAASHSILPFPAAMHPSAEEPPNSPEP
jgi:hypothetical protein